MKPASSSPGPARWTCRVVRQWSGVLGGIPSSHRASCPDCQAYVQAVDVLDATLRRESSRVASAPAASLERRIVQAVEGVRREARPQASRRPYLGWAAGFAAATALAVALVSFNRPSESAGRIAAPAPVTNAEAEAMVAAVESFSTQLADSVIPSAGELVANNPLQHELGSIYSDARSVLGFLALNFLPSANEAAPPRRG